MHDSVRVVMSAECNYSTSRHKVYSFHGRYNAYEEKTDQLSGQSLICLLVPTCLDKWHPTAFNTETNDISLNLMNIEVHVGKVIAQWLTVGRKSS